LLENYRVNIDAGGEFKSGSVVDFAQPILAARTKPYDDYSERHS
jgi:hypothetical protein